MHRLLVVDDEPQLLFSLREYLTRVGFEVRAADSGARGLESLMESSPDLIVADILMDGMDGFEFQRRVNALTGGQIPFIFLTAKGDLRDRLTGFQGGADDYIVKPFEPAELQARIAAVFARVQRTRLQTETEVLNRQGDTLAQVSEGLENPIADVACELGSLRAKVEEGSLVDHHLAKALDRMNDLGEMLADLSWASGSAATAPALNKEPQRIAPIVRTAAASAARLAAEKSVHLKITCGGLLTGVVDGQVLGRALAGILERVVAASPDGGDVLLAARRAKESGIEIVMSDGGATAVGTTNWEGAQATRALAMARHVVRAHGGRFEMRSDEEQGPSMVIWLPGRVAKHVGKRA